jgi:caa(3)-type oxidase subunit IV
MSHAAEFDEYGHKDHGHVIVSLFTLRFVLIALLICTLLTSGSAWAEEAIASTFHVVIPQWVNAFVALSIAIVKTALVVGFFMQLKYDNPMNTIIFVFTILTVFSFLGFTSLDLCNRDSIDRFKNVYAYPGGDLSAGPGTFVKDAVPVESIVVRAQRIAAANPDPSHHAEGHAPDDRNTQSITDMGFLPEKPASGSSSNLSRPVTGITLPNLPGYRGTKPAPSHAAEPASTAPAPEHTPAPSHR